jgi:thiaminase/transcriptional activator TenA
MTNTIDYFSDFNTLFGKLRLECSKEWDDYCNHDFVLLAGNGKLPEKCFRHYLEQDYIFLIHFARAYALAVYKSESLDEMRAAASSINAILNYEMEIHVKYCLNWGLKEEEMQRIEEAKANMAYTRFVLDKGLAGDILDLHVALSPCIVGYAVIGRNLMDNPEIKLEDNPYKEWIEAYAAQEYQDVAKKAVDHLDELAASRMGKGRFEKLVRTFRQAILLEIGFWDMGLHVQT